MNTRKRVSMFVLSIRARYREQIKAGPSIYPVIELEGGGVQVGAYTLHTALTLGRTDYTVTRACPIHDEGTVLLGAYLSLPSALQLIAQDVLSYDLSTLLYDEDDT